MKNVIDGIIIDKEKGILLVNKKGVWILPGGKQDKEETDEVTLRREIKEELSGAEIILGEPYKPFSGITPFSKKQVEVKTYFAKLIGEVLPSREIEGAQYTNNPLTLNISTITKDILVTLQEDGYL